jgi:hypothetical protein
MFHFRKIALPLFIATVLLSSCSQSDSLIAEDTNKETARVQDGCDVIFRMQSNYSPTTRSSIEEGDDTDLGTPNEYKVNNAIVYLFDSSTKKLVNKYELKKFNNPTFQDNNTIYDTEILSVPQGTYDIFVIANSERVISATDETTFLADIDDATYAQGQIEDISKGIVMSNMTRDANDVLDPNDDQTRVAPNLNKAIKKPSDGVVQVININLERVLARLDVAKEFDSYDLKYFDTATQQNKKYATVKLDGFHIVNMPTKYYTFRHHSSSANEPTWTLDNFKMISDSMKVDYVIDPYFYKKTEIDAANFNNGDGYYKNFFLNLRQPSNITWLEFKPVNDQDPYKHFYCLENCMVQPAQMNGYSTGVIFKASIEPEDGTVYTLNKTSGKLEVITDKAQYPQVVYYYNCKFYDSVEARNEAIATSQTPQTNEFTGQKFEKNDTGTGYRCYYNYWIKHLDNNNNNEMGVMEFAVVRNNLYSMRVHDITGVGNGEPEPTTNPDTPDEGNTFLKVQITVKRWIIRNLTNITL